MAATSYDFVLSAPAGEGDSEKGYSAGHSVTFVAWTQFGLRWEASVVVNARDPEPTWGWEVCAGPQPTKELIMEGKYAAMTAELPAPFRVTMTRLSRDGGAEETSELSLTRMGTLKCAHCLPAVVRADARFGLRIYKM